MLIFGASGHAKVVIDCLESFFVKIAAVYDDDLTKTEINGYKVLGPYDPDILHEHSLIIAVGDNRIRKIISKKIQHFFGNAFHTSSIIAKSASVGEGTVIFHNSVVQSDVRIGKHVIINTSSSIDHECVINDYVHISPNATLCGNVHVDEGTHIGASATLIPNIKIGRWVTIGAGAVIVNDIPDYAVVVGNPGRIIKYKDSTLYEI